VLHYHAGGLPEFLARGWRHRVACWIYGRGAWAVGLSKQVPVPGLAFGAAREFVVANGLDVPAVSGGRAPGDLELRLLFVGNLFESKGVLVLAEAACALAAETGAAIRLTLVGAAAEPQTQQALADWQRRAPANLTIELPGTLTGEAKWQAYAEADVFVFPSYYPAENQPLVVIEALACGLPVVATRWRGIPELVADGVTGILVEARDSGSLVAGLRSVARDASLRARLGARARQTYQSNFSVATHVANMKAVLGAAVEAAANNQE
jgi:glycosyltransferase involved in cell wall biosynthesis